MKAFDHFTPKTVNEALDLLSRFNGEGKMLAGGTDLMLHMKSGLSRPEAIINIKRLPELGGIAFDESEGLRLGALTTLRDLTRSTLIRERYPSLAQAAGVMASEQIRSFATLGGNLCNGSPSADLAPPVMVLGGTALLASAAGERLVSMDEFFLGPGKTVLKPDELLKEIQIPPPAGRAIYLKHAPRAYMDIAVVGVGIRLRLDGALCREARIVLAAVAPVPLRVRQAELELEGEIVSDQRIARAADLAAEACTPIDDIRGSAWYRKRMVGVLTRRGLKTLISSEKALSEEGVV
jgi:carbon-monoxide dehydrogenase medium subunit